MFRFKFKGINFFSGNFNEVKKQFDKGGVLVAPAASALAEIKKKNNYYKALKSSDIAILDSGFFCILIRLFKNYNVIKLSGFLFLRRFLLQYKNNKKLLLINPSIKENKINSKYLKSLGIRNFKTYISPIYKKIEDKKLIKIINKFKPHYIMINLGGGVQEILGIYIKKNIKFKTSIMCTGAAIAFLTGEQAPINKYVDRAYLGWFIRLIWNPKKYYKRTLKSFNLIKLFI
jgi:UDP-N-acetyl-D-mannosaminuronic acid transferase (WecB/TagA/CpsF family)